MVLANARLPPLTSQTTAGHASTLVADEGGLGLGGITNTAALELLSNAIEAAELMPGDQVAIAVDVAATQLYDGELYLFGGSRVDGSTLLDRLEGWYVFHLVVSVEDPLAEDDWAGWAEATRRLGDRVQLVGDDLFATSLEAELGGRGSFAGWAAPHHAAAPS